ncbi:hypothetical protein M9H77_33474 [Catharanthus roseus]|uniref:Uncharacterized protein n=1 Tax=Catharanthus roseus TaxID=4058 RepID=A0ACB9ZJD8_CATRO|nr:hypothetical protein M9H77_33474 [Catharanthus roseus]
MQHLRRTRFLMKNRLSNYPKSYNGLSYFLEHPSSKRVSDMGLAPFQSTTIRKTAVNCFVKKEMMNLGSASNYARGVVHPPMVIHESGVLPVPFKEKWSRRNFMTFQSQFQPARSNAMGHNMPCFPRFLSSKASQSADQKTRKDVSTVEDPFDAPTYNIPEKPVTFTEGASYSIIILAGIGIAAGAAYGVFKELIFEPKEYKVFNKALDRVQNDGQVRVRIGAPIIGFGSESRNRAARQRIPNRIWTDENGIEHVEVNFYIRGPHGNGIVYAEMFKDKEDKKWKFTYLVVQIKAPSPADLMLESYIPA